MALLLPWRTTPTTIVLPIENMQQTGSGTCWAVCLAQALQFLTGHRIGERDLCAAAGLRSDEGATNAEMAKIVARFARVSSYTLPATTPERVAELLAQRQPIILTLSVGKGFIAHAALLRGVTQDAGTRTWSATVNDPNLANGFSMFVPFDRLHATWRSSLVITPKQRS